MNKIPQIIKSKESEAFKFTPNPVFYRTIGINRKRWAQLYRGEKEPTLSELQRIAEYFNISIHELIDEKQSSPTDS